MAQATLEDYDVVTSTTTTYNFDFDSVAIGYKVDVTAPSYANGGAVSEVQTQTFSNPSFSLQGVVITERTSTQISYDTLRELATRQYNPASKYLTLKVDYGNDSSVLLPDSAGETSGIRVVISGFNVSLGQSRYTGNNKQVGTGTITFIETA